MVAREAQLKNFFQNVEVATRGVQQTVSVARWTVSVCRLGSATDHVPGQDGQHF